MATNPEFSYKNAMFRGAWLVTFVAVAACSDVGTTDNASPIFRENASAQGNERGSVGFGAGDTMCIYTVANEVEPLDVFEFTRSTGGRSCYRAGRRTIFAPASTPACEADVPPFLRVEQATTREDGERQFLACMALTNANVASDDNTVLLVHPSTSGDDFKDREFALYVADLRALATNGALIATSLQSGFGIACFDTDQPELLQRQIETSVHAPDGVTILLRKSSCSSEMDQANMRALD